MRRHASPHPEEPSASRPRVVDRRPAQPEPEEKRAFNDAASRSRDDGPGGEPEAENFEEGGEEEEEGGASNFDFSDDFAFDGGASNFNFSDEYALDDIHRNYMLRREEVPWGQIHNLTVQSNSTDVYTSMLSDSNAAMLCGSAPLPALLSDQGLRRWSYD